MRGAVVIVVGALLCALMTGCDDEGPATAEGPPPHLVRQLQEGRSIRAVDACDAVRAIPSVEERAREVLGLEVTHYRDHYGESEHSSSASCALVATERSEEGLYFGIHQESDIAVDFEAQEIEFFPGCRAEPKATWMSAACASDLTMSINGGGSYGDDPVCSMAHAQDDPDDACASLLSDFLAAIDAQDPDENLDPDDEGRPEGIARMAGGDNDLYLHDVCKAIASAGLEDDLAQQLEADDLVIYSSVYGHPREEEVRSCAFYVDVDLADEGREHVLSLALAFSRPPVEPAVGDDEVFPGCLVHRLRVVCGEHLVLRLEGGGAHDETASIDDYPLLAHDVLVALSKQD